MCRCLVFLLSIPATLAAGQSAAGPIEEDAYRAVPNLVTNADFEMDWMHNRVTVNTRFLLLEQSDWGYGQADGMPDYWIVPETARLDPAVRKFGTRSLRLQGTAGQVVYLLGETDPRDGGAFYNAFRPLPKELVQHVPPRALRFGAWCKTVDAKTAPSLSVVVEYGAFKEKPTTRPYSVAYSTGSHDWEYREITIPADATLGPPHAAVLRLTFQGPGTAWFDGVVGTETDPAEPNLLPNGGFEIGKNDWPDGWSRAVLWSWARREYYRFTGWSHDKGTMIGGASLAPLGRNGGRALQLTVLPGDNLAVPSQPVRLNQSEPRVLEASAWVRTLDLRWLEIKAKNERGEWLPQLDLSGCMGTDEQYRNRVAGIGTHDWEYVRVHFAPSRPVREVTLWLCARGIDGKQMARNAVGTAWFDDVALRERGTLLKDLAQRKVVVPAPVKPLPLDSYRILDFDLGERLWGQNEFRATYALPKGGRFDPALALIGPTGRKTPLSIEPMVGKTRVEVRRRYDLTELPADWQQHLHFDTPWPVRFATPSSPIALRLAGTYFYPDEKLEVGVNFNITLPSLKEAGKCQIVVQHPKGKLTLLDTTDIGKSLWTIDNGRPRLLREGYVDARNLLVIEAPLAGLPVHPHDHPVRDCRVVATLFDRQGKILARQQSDPIGVLEKSTRNELPATITKTAVSANGTLLVNGKPYVFNCFPATRTDLGNVSRMLNFPKSHKILPLPYPKDLVIHPKDEVAWRAKIQAFVRDNKADAKLFGWYFAHDGETTFWFDAWKDLAASQRKAAGWVREVDANHVILSAHWLFGHGALTPQAGAHFSYLDVIDVEPGLTWTPNSGAVRKAASRPIAIVAGLECYYFQPPRLLRWRMYEALRQGANGVGICPSGMLASKPEIVSFLRGLHGEVQGLEPLLAGQPPAQPTSSPNPNVILWERRNGRARYLVAMTGARVPEAMDRDIALPVPAGTKEAEVLFEGRRIAVRNGRIIDRFDAPYTVHVYRMSEK